MNRNQRYRFVKGISVLLLLGLAACAEDENEAVCKRLLSCGTALKADGVTVWGPLYGDDGSCWSAQSAEECGSQCKTQLAGIMPHTPEDMDDSTAKACGAESCSSDADCEPFARAKTCDAELKVCVGCKTDADCGGAEGSCKGFPEGSGIAVPCAEANAACYCS